MICPVTDLSILLNSTGHEPQLQVSWFNTGNFSAYPKEEKKLPIPGFNSETNFGPLEATNILCLVSIDESVHCKMFYS